MADRHDSEDVPKEDAQQTVDIVKESLDEAQQTGTAEGKPNKDEPENAVMESSETKEMDDNWVKEAYGISEGSSGVEEAGTEGWKEVSVILALNIIVTFRFSQLLLHSCQKSLKFHCPKRRNQLVDCKDKIIKKGREKWSSFWKKSTVLLSTARKLKGGKQLLFLPKKNVELEKVQLRTQ